MPEPDAEPSRRLPPRRIHPLYTRRLREIFAAPEFERLLAQRDVDFQMLDQVDALRVRIDRGLSILRDRIQTTQARARRQRKITLTSLLVASGACLWIAFHQDALMQSLGYSVAIGLMVVGTRSALVLGEDLRTLEGLENRYEDPVRLTTEIEELAELSREIYSEIEIVVGIKEPHAEE